MGRLGCCEDEDVATLAVRAMVCCGYMPYGWLGPVSKGLSPLDVVAKEPVELTEARWLRGDGELGPRLCRAAGRPSGGIASRTFAVLLRVAVRRRSRSGGGFDVEVVRWTGSFRSWSWRSLLHAWLALAGRKPSETEGMKSSSSRSTSWSSSKTLAVLGGREGASLSLLRRSMTPKTP
jgi:hypothetical protein